MSLVEHAAAALEDLNQRTAHYAFTTEGLVADPQILSHVKRMLKKQDEPTSPIDILVEDEKFLDEIRNGKGRYQAARLVGLEPVRVLRRLRIDEDFRDRVAVAEAESLEKIVEKVRELAEDGEKWAALKMLESKNPDEYDISPKNKGFTFNVNVGVVGTGSTYDPIMKEIKELEADLRAQRELQGITPMLEIEAADTEEL